MLRQTCRCLFSAPSARLTQIKPSVYVTMIKKRENEVIRSTFLNGVTIDWNLERGEMSFFDIPCALFWLDPSLLQLLEPLAQEIGTEMFSLLVAHSSSLGTDEDYQAMVNVLGPTFPEGFIAWGDAVAAAGWGRFELPEFDEEAKSATVIVRNPWELRLQKSLSPDKARWGCPFVQGKVTGIFSHAFGVNCWAHQQEISQNAEGEYSVSFHIRASTRTIESELLALRQKRFLEEEAQLVEELHRRTSDLERARLELRKYSEGLEQKVQERTRELMTAAEKAEFGTRAKNEILATISHEIRTPMNGILGMTRALIESDLDEEQRELAATVEDCAQSLLTILNDVLDLSRIEAGKFELHPVAFSLAKELQRVNAFLSSRVREKNVQLRFQVCGETPDRLVGDPDRLRQVLINLVSNAVKFSSSDGVVLVWIATERKNDKDLTLRFNVVDKGIGIPADKQQMIFEAFAQADQSISQRFGGSGLGLTISSRLVHLMGGNIEVHSRPGIGSLFSFTALFGIPGPDTADAPASTEPPVFKQTRPLRILVAEDHVVNQRVVVAMLKKAGHHVVVAGDGAEAISLWEQEAVDLVLMDIQMPVKDGVLATQEIREREAAAGPRRTPIIALTAYAMAGDREKYLAQGFDEYVTKPINKTELFAVLHNIAEKL